jgi:hypothetical protein
VIVVAAATCGYDATLSSMIWNPPVATACAKLAIAAVLWDPHVTIARAVLATLASWIAVRCHMSAFIVAIPVIAWLLVAPAWAHDWRALATRAGVVAIVILLLQVPSLTSRGEQQTPPSQVTSSIAAVLSQPGNGVHAGAAIRFVPRALHFNLVRPFDEDQKTLPLFAAALVAASIATALLVRARAAVAVPMALALLLIATQPARARMAWSFHRMPQYGAIMKGCQSISRRHVAVRGMQTTFEVPPDAQPEWLCTLAGADIRADQAAPLAIVSPAGAVTYR